jgi:hypothetical protein
MRDMRIQQRVVETLRMRDEHLTPESPVGFARWIHHQAPSKGLPNQGEAEYPQLNRDPACDTSSGAHERKSRDAIWSLKREGGAP